MQVLSDALHAVDESHVAVFVHVHLSAASDIVNLSISPRGLQVTFGFDSIALQLFRPYLSGPMQPVLENPAVSCHRFLLRLSTRISPSTDSVHYVHTGLGEDDRAPWP
jgi:hypothetical protein